MGAGARRARGGSEPAGSRWALADRPAVCDDLPRKRRCFWASVAVCGRWPGRSQRPRHGGCQGMGPMC